MAKYCNELVELALEANQYIRKSNNRKTEASDKQQPDKSTAAGTGWNNRNYKDRWKNFVRLENEKKSLLEFHRNLKEQLSKVH